MRRQRRAPGWSWPGSWPRCWPGWRRWSSPPRWAGAVPAARWQGRVLCSGRCRRWPARRAGMATAAAGPGHPPRPGATRTALSTRHGAGRPGPGRWAGRARGPVCGPAVRRGWWPTGAGRAAGSTGTPGGRAHHAATRRRAGAGVGFAGRCWVVMPREAAGHLTPGGGPPDPVTLNGPLGDGHRPGERVSARRPLRQPRLGTAGGRQAGRAAPARPGNPALPLERPGVPGDGFRRHAGLPE